MSKLSFVSLFLTKILHQDLYNQQVHAIKFELLLLVVVELHVVLHAVLHVVLLLLLSLLLLFLKRSPVQD